MILPALVFERSCLEPFQPGTARKQITSNPDIKTFTAIPIHYLTKVVETRQGIQQNHPPSKSPFLQRPDRVNVLCHQTSGPHHRGATCLSALHPSTCIRIGSHPTRSVVSSIHTERQTDRQTARKKIHQLSKAKMGSTPRITEHIGNLSSPSSRT
jgi:hypothetical protein